MVAFDKYFKIYWLPKDFTCPLEKHSSCSRVRPVAVTSRLKRLHVLLLVNDNKTTVLGAQHYYSKIAKFIHAMCIRVHICAPFFFLKLYLIWV